MSMLLTSIFCWPEYQDHIRQSGSMYLAKSLYFTSRFQKLPICPYPRADFYGQISKIDVRPVIPPWHADWTGDAKRRIYRLSFPYAKLKKCRTNSVATRPYLFDISFEEPLKSEFFHHFFRILCGLHLIVWLDDHSVLVNQIGRSHDPHIRFSETFLFLPHVIRFDRFKIFIRQ